MTTALKAAEAVFADENATQEQIDTATEALNKAIKALAPATGNNPSTFDGFPLELCLITMAVSALAVLMLIGLRKRFVR